MFIGRFNSIYDENTWGTGNTIEQVIADIQNQNDIIINTNRITFYKAEQIQVTKRIEYIILPS